MNPLFETHAEATIKRVTSTFNQRGAEYSDTWRDAQWLALKATCKQLGITIPESKLRAVAAAVMCDVKYARLGGGYKDDTVVDGIAYNALWAEEMVQQAKSVIAFREPSLKDLVSGLNGPHTSNGENHRGGQAQATCQRTTPGE